MTPRLILDLRFSPDAATSDDERLMFLPEFAGMVRRKPRRLFRLLRSHDFETVELRRERLALTTVQAAAIVILSLARAQRFVERRGDDHATVHSAPDFRIRAIADLPATLVGEPVLTAAYAARATLLLRRRNGERRVRRYPSVVSFVRAEGSLSWLGQKVGGVATHTSGLVNGFADQGVEVSVFAADQPDAVDAARTTIVRPQRMFQFVPWLTPLALSNHLVRAAKNTPADFVYQHHALGSYAGLKLARRLDVPLALGFHASDVWSEKNYGGGRVPLERLATAVERATVANADLLVVISDAVRDQLVEWGIDPARILVNPSGVDVERFAAFRSESPPAWRTRLGLDQAPTVGFVGTFGLWHGVRELPAMIEEAHASRPDARWVLIGNGSLFDEVSGEIARRGLSDVVHMPGMITHEQALQLLSACDVCVSPHVRNADGTRFVGSPTKLFEYMGLGKPIVASDLEQIGEVLEHERTALLHEPGDAAASAAFVVRVLDDPELAERLGAAALAEAQERYSWVAHTRRILDALADGRA